MRLGLTKKALAVACGLNGPAETAQARGRSGVATGSGVNPGSRLGRLLAARAMERRRRALELAGRAMRALHRAGVSARIVGSLAKGTFRAGSDVDFLIEARGGLSDSRVVGIVEESMKGFPFDVTFADRADPRLLAMMREEARLAYPRPGTTLKRDLSGSR